MELTGKCIKILPPTRFTSKRSGEEYVKNYFVVETGGQYSRTVQVTVMGADRFNEMHIAVGKTYSIFFDVESREWKDKWFTDILAYRAVCVDGQSAIPSNTEDRSGLDAAPFL